MKDPPICLLFFFPEILKLCEVGWSSIWNKCSSMKNSLPSPCSDNSVGEGISTPPIDEETTRGHSHGGATRTSHTPPSSLLFGCPLGKNAWWIEWQ